MKKNDRMLIISVLALSAFALLMMFFFRKTGSEVVVTIDGNEVANYDLKENVTYTIEGDHGEKNTFRIMDGYVDMIDANCPDKLCINQKNIHYNKETIVCLPNKVVLEIRGGEENIVDSVVN